MVAVLKKVYLVQGSTGYEAAEIHPHPWPVCVFENEIDARDYVKVLTEEYETRIKKQGTYAIDITTVPFDLDPNIRVVPGFKTSWHYISIPKGPLYA